MLLKPSLEEVLLAASKIKLPEIEAKKFFYHYESNGWKVGRTRMVSFNAALAGWKIRWQERHPQESSTPKSWAARQLDVMIRKDRINQQ